MADPNRSRKLPAMLGNGFLVISSMNLFPVASFLLGQGGAPSRQPYCTLQQQQHHLQQYTALEQLFKSDSTRLLFLSASSTSENDTEDEEGDYDDDEGDYEDDYGSEAENLLQAKLQILEDVVIKLNVTKCQDQTEIQTLQSHVQELQASVKATEQRLQASSQSNAQQVEALESKWKQEKESLVTNHQVELQKLEKKLLSHARLEQDEAEQQLRQQTSVWKSEREQEWKESLEIATAAVKAAEKREQDLLTKLEHLELRYHQEAAEYKDELDELQEVWKLENQELRVDVKRLHKEVSNAKRERDQEASMVIESLNQKKKDLEVALGGTKEQISMLRLQYSTQQQMAQEEWKTQLDKERKFYTETIRLLREENTALRQKEERKRGFWSRLFRRFGRRSAINPKRRVSRGSFQ